ncbi:MAG: F0F1 ATP synthase subunit B [Candidatus Saccharimonadaceae bacterium]
MNFLTNFAETAEANESIFAALGIDWRLLILQIVAFLILVWLLGKFVYPWLMKSVDERQKNIEEAAKAAKIAQASAAESQVETAKLLAQARKESAEIVETAKLEATEIANTSEARAKSTAEKIVADAHSQISKDIDKARRELHDETLELIALATEKIVRKKMDSKTDETLIAEMLKEAK